MSTIDLAKLSECFVSGTIPDEMAGDVYDNRAIGARLELIRRSLKVSQEALASMLEPLLAGEKMTGQKWNNYAKGRDRIPVPAAIALCTLSGADLDFIYRGEWGALTPAVATKLQQAMTNPARRFKRP